MKFKGFYLIALVLMLTSCSNNWHYYGNRGKVIYADLHTPFTDFQGIEVVKVGRDSLLPIKFVNDSQDYILVDNQKFVLSDLWADFVKSDDELNEKVNWYISDSYKITTSQRNYLYIDLGNDLQVLREYHYPFVIDYTNASNPVVYTQNVTLNFDVHAFGDFNKDTYLDYAYINDSLNRLEFDTFKNGNVIKNDSVYLNLRYLPTGSDFSAYKIKHVQKHSGWWHKGRFIYSGKPQY